jgi:replicative DNA helicase
MGKTAVALNLAMNAASLNYPVCLFSLEMSKEELATRFLSSTGKYTNVDIRNANVNFTTLVNGSHKIANLPIMIDDTPSLNLFELRSKVRKQILKYGTKLIIIDYLQLMSVKADNREQEISQISRNLKAISKEFYIPVVVLSQLNRKVEERADKRPKLHDLRESGSIEMDADIVCFLFRPKYYGLEYIKLEREEISSEGLILIDGAKNRNGGLFSVPLYHNQNMSVIQESKFELDNEPSEI